MNIEEIKRNRFKRFTLIMLLVFTIIMILGAKNSICASEIQIRSISNNYLWKVSDTADYGIAKLYKDVQNLTDAQIQNQELPYTNNPPSDYNLVLGKTLGGR